MVLPAIIGGVLLVGSTWYVLDAGENKLQEIAEDTAQDLIDAGHPILEGVGEAIGEGLELVAAELGELGSDIGSALLGLIRYLGIAVIESMEDTYAYIAGKVGGKKVQITSSVTILGILMFTAFYIFAQLPSGGNE